MFPALFEHLRQLEKTSNRHAKSPQPSFPKHEVRRRWNLSGRVARFVQATTERNQIKVVITVGTDVPYAPYVHPTVRSVRKGRPANGTNNRDRNRTAGSV
jgi:hypothetical protein